MDRSGRELTPAEVLALIPQQRPFRFVDELVHVDGSRARGRYRFRQDELFYAGHFPGHPITPGAILIEAMAQVGVVALGIYLYGLEVPVDELRRTFTVFADGQAEFHAVVLPGDAVVIEAEKVYWRRKKIRSRVELRLGDGRLAAASTLSGMGVSHDRL